MSEELTTQPEEESKPETPQGESAADVSAKSDDTSSTETQSDSDAEASFAAGFQRATKGETPEPEPAPEPQYTPEQIKEAFEKLSALETEIASRKARDDKVNGALGFLTNAVRELKAQPGRQPVKLNADSFKKLNEAYPELAEALSEDLGEVIGAGASVDEEAIATKAAERATEAVKKAELDRLSDDHPDWRDVVRSDGFAKFRAAWSPELQEKFDNSWNAAFVGKRIAEFKEAQAKAQAQANASERNLRRSIPAKGVTVAHTTNLSDEERFARGFKRARGLA